MNASDLTGFFRFLISFSNLSNFKSLKKKGYITVISTVYWVSPYLKIWNFRFSHNELYLFILRCLLTSYLIVMHFCIMMLILIYHRRSISSIHSLPTATCLHIFCKLWFPVSWRHVFSMFESLKKNKQGFLYALARKHVTMRLEGKSFFSNLWCLFIWSNSF